MSLGIENKVVDIQYLGDPSKIGGRRPIESTVRKNVTWIETFKTNQFDYQRVMEKGYRAKVIIAFEPSLERIESGTTHLVDLDGIKYNIYDVRVIPTGFGVDGSYVFYVKEIFDR